MKAKDPWEFSIAFAHMVGVGHVNTGTQLAQAYKTYADTQRKPDGTLDHLQAIQLSVPALTNLAFGLELLLKAHHFQHKGEYPKLGRDGHNIAKLGRLFPDASMAKLREYYLEFHANPAVPKGVEFRWIVSPAGGSPKASVWAPKDISTYDAAIDYIGPMFERWRYIYEELDLSVEVEGAFSPVYIAAMAVHKAIETYKGNRKITVKDAPAASPENPNGA